MRWGAAFVLIGLLVACREDFGDHNDPATFPGRFVIVAEGRASPASLVEPAVFLVRTKREGARIARRVGIEEIADALESWTDYRHRALIVVVGGTQADQTTRLRMERLDVPAFSGQLIVWARVETVSDSASAPGSLPWLIASTAADAALLTEECVLRIDRQDVITPCPPTER